MNLPTVKMLRILTIASLLLGAYASHFNKWENFIDYSKQPVYGYGTPYAYQPRKDTKLVVKKVSPYLDDGKGHLLIPEGLHHEVIKVEESKSEVGTTIAFTAFGVIKKAAVFLVQKIPGLIIGTLLGLGICHLTSLFGDFSEALVEVKREVRSLLANEERVAEATKFVQNAIRKYRSLQDSE